MNRSDQPLVSVIITTYQNEKYLPRAIESVLHQTYPNIELIVVDDNPPESEARKKTEAVMECYPQAIYLRHSENKNGAAARNTGIRAASGSYIAFLDNDDLYFSGHIDACVRAVQAHPNCKAVLCGTVKISRSIVWDRIDPPAGDVVKALLFRENALGTGSNLFVQADTVREINGFDERFRRHQDVEFGLRFFSRASACTLDAVQIVKEMDSYSNMPDFEKFLETKRLLWNTFADLLSTLTEEEQKRYYAGQYSALLYAACKLGDREKIAWTVSQLSGYRALSEKEKLLVLLSRMRLFGLYERLKTNLKRRKSSAFYRQLAASLSEYDKAVLDLALTEKK